MTMYTLREAAALIPGAQVLGDETTAFARIATDSRTVGPGDLFVALKGDRFDAHDFLVEVAGRGAAAVMVSRSPGDWRVPALRVADTRIALGALAHGWRQRFTLPLVTVTGSNGKTTVKEMIAAIFAAHVGKDARLATRGNLNNDVGVPLTLFELSAAHRFAVVELGMNHPGETAELARIAAPTVALINNAQREHQEFMATVEAVALEHAAALHALGRDGIAVFPADDAYAPIWRAASADRRIIDFALAGVGADADATAPTAAVVGQRRADGSLAVQTPAGAFELRLRAFGAHNARNALAAAAAGCAAGVPPQAIKAGLEAFEPVKGRLQEKRAALAPLAGVRVLDDTYNANPDSMRAAIDVLAALPAPRVLVIGDMGEVGDEGPAFHREIGAYARERGIDALHALGGATPLSCEAFGAGAAHHESVDALVAALCASALPGGTTILVKGSRFMRMERVVDALVGGH